MANERKLYQKFKDKILKTDPNCWVYKIPDWIGGPKRPADFFLVVNGVAFLLEFKSANGVLTKYQSYQLADFIVAGGEALVYVEGKETLDEFVLKIMKIVKDKT